MSLLREKAIHYEGYKAKKRLDFVSADYAAKYMESLLWPLNDYSLYLDIADSLGHWSLSLLGGTIKYRKNELTKLNKRI